MREFPCSFAATSKCRRRPPRPQTKPLMMEGEPTAAVNPFTLSATSELWSSCPRPGRAQKGLTSTHSYRSTLPAHDPNAFACAAPRRQQRSRGPLPRKPAISAAEGVPSALRPSTATAPAFASAAPRIRASSATSPLARGRRRPVAESPPRISTSTPSTISASTTRQRADKPTSTAPSS